MLRIILLYSGKYFVFTGYCISNVHLYRTLNLANILPVDLNSILYNNFRLLSLMYNFSYVNNASRSSYWQNQAEQRRTAIIDVFWDESRLSFYDFNQTSNNYSNYWTPSSIVPFWAYIWPDSVLQNQTNAQKALAPLAYLTANLNGTLPASVIETGLQWDFPNSWPPHIYFAIAALRNLPLNLTTASYGDYSNAVSQFKYLPTNQLGVNQSEIPTQPIVGSNSNITNATSIGNNGNVGTFNNTSSWSEGVAQAIANRYLGASFCSW